MDENNKRPTFEEFIRKEVLRSRIWSIFLSLLVAAVFSIIIVVIVHNNMANSVKSIQEATIDIVNAYVDRLVNVYYKPSFQRKLTLASEQGIDSIKADNITIRPATNITVTTPTITSVQMIYPTMDIKLTGVVKTASGTYIVEYIAGKRQPVYKTTMSVIRAFMKNFSSIEGINLYTDKLQPVIVTTTLPANIFQMVPPSQETPQFKHVGITRAYVVSPFHIKSVDNGYLYMVFSIHSYSILWLIVSFIIALLFVSIVSIITSIQAAKKISHNIAMPLEELSSIVEGLDLSRNELPQEDLQYIAEDAPKEIYTLAQKIQEIIDKNTDFLKQLQRARENTLRAYEHASQREKELYDAYYNFATTLARIAEKHDDTTGKHIQRVGEIAGFIAEKMNLPPMLVDQIRKFAPLHDIGKIMVPDKILQKKGPLTEEEWELMKKHTEFGAELLGNKQHFMVARNIALYHHEKFDGSGYPFGLKGNQIPIEAQIVSIADVYDALRDERPYKPALTHEESVKIILEGDRRTKPEHFNPQILEIFKQYHEQIRDIYERLK